MTFFLRQRASLVPFLLLVASLVWTASAHQCGGQIIVTSGPTLTMQPNASTPLAGLLEFSTNIPTRVAMKLHGTGEAWGVASEELQTNHAIPLLGFAPNSQYTLNDIALSSQEGALLTLGDVFSISTDPLPADFPNLEVLASDPHRMEPGLTLVPAFKQEGRSRVQDYTFAVDAQGTVRWYTDRDLSYVRRLPNGQLFYGWKGSVGEMDMLGNVNASWHPANHSTPGAFPPDSVAIPDTARFHHDAYPLPNGNIVTIDKRTALVENFPTSESDPDAPRVTAEVDYDPIVEFTRQGAVVQEWNLLESLDPTRIGYGVIRPQEPHDWAHSNAVIHDARDNSLIISVRHQDALVKVSRSTGELVWILGPHDNWGPQFEPYLLTPVGEPFEWSYHTHSPMFLPDGNILVFDNGNYRASPVDPPLSSEETYSRAVEYAIDEDTMEVTQVWEYGSDTEEIIYAASGGDADWLSITDNVLIALGPTSIDGTVVEVREPRIIEVTREGERVFDLRVSYPAGDGVVYRSERIPTLYPTGYRVWAIPEPTSLTLLAVSTIGAFFLRLRFGQRGRNTRAEVV